MLHIEYYIIANCFSYIVVISITFFILKKKIRQQRFPITNLYQEMTQFFLNMKNVIEMTTIYEKQLAII